MQKEAETLTRANKPKRQADQESSIPAMRELPSVAAREATGRKPREERWEELLNAAANIFYEKGYEASSLQDIANEVGILKGSIYYYIKTKKDLRDNLVGDVHYNGIKLIKSAALTAGNSIEKLEAMIITHVTYLCNNLPKAVVYLQQFKNVLEDSEENFNKHAYRDVVEAVIREGQATGYFLPDLAPSFAAQAILSSLNSISDWYAPRSSGSPEHIASHMARILVRGHATPKGLRFLSRRDNAESSADS